MRAAAVVLSSKRVDRALLGAPIALRNIVGMHITAPQRTPHVQDFLEQFVPLLRFHNPRLEFAYTESECIDRPPRVELALAGEQAHVVNLLLYEQSHQVMERVLQVDQESG